MTTTIAVVATGAMGSGLGARLAQHGARVVTALEGRSAASVARAQAAGMHGVTDAELAQADLFLSVVPPDQAVPLARRMAPHLAQAGRKPAYLDMNAVMPDTAQQVADVLAPTGAPFVDGGIIGAPPKPGGKGPTLYLSGPADEAAALLRGLGLAVTVLPGPLTAASALKMSYAGITKGVTALGVAMILGAQRYGVDQALAQELAASQPEMLARLARGVPDMLPKAYRWVPEMQEIAGFLGQDDPAHGIYGAIAALYRQIAADQAGDGALAARLRAFFPSET